MSKSVKKNSKSIKVKKNSATERVCKQDVSFSFTFMTTNNRFNFKACDEKIKALLIDRLEEISKHEFAYWMGKDKKHGLEMLPAEIIRFSPNNLQLTSDDKVIVFRFGREQYRIICFKLGNCPILHIIGFDLKFNAYKHGS